MTFIDPGWLLVPESCSVAHFQQAKKNEIYKYKRERERERERKKKEAIVKVASYLPAVHRKREKAKSKKQKNK